MMKKQKKLIQEKDNELRRMQDMLAKMQGQLAEKKNQLNNLFCID